jgi:hypothetical protein
MARPWAVRPWGWGLVLVAVVGGWLLTTTPPVVVPTVTTEAAVDPSQQPVPQPAAPALPKLLD